MLLQLEIQLGSLSTEVDIASEALKTGLFLDTGLKINLILKQKTKKTYGG